MNGVDLWTDLRCPQCGKTARVKNLVQKAARMHQCPKLHGLVAPMVREGVKAEVVVHEPEGYVRGNQHQVDPERGRPIMNMETRYQDGHTDLTVFAPVAVAGLRR